MKNPKRKHAVWLLPLAAAILTFLCAASPTLEATAEGIAVLELPAPKVNGINISSGIASISVADLDPDISADLRILVSLLDENGEVIEHAQVKLIDPNTSRSRFVQSYSKAIRSLVALQSLGQLEQRYNWTKAKIVMDSCQILIFTFVAPGAQSTAEEFSKALGYRTVQTGSPE